MAWNQPGGGNGGDKDPWGNRGGQAGPPDLDEALRKLQAMLGGLFGGRKSPGAPGAGSSGPGAPGLGLILVLAVLGWFAAGIYIIEPAEVGVVLRLGKYSHSSGSGPHWAPYFIDRVSKVNVEEVRNAEIGFRSASGSNAGVPHESLMLTKDENIIDIQFAVQYQVKDAADFLFQVRDPELTLRQATESAVREIVGKSNMDFVITEGREQVASQVKLLTQDILDRYKTGLQISAINMQSAQPPREVQEAFSDAVRAREDEQRKKNEARAYAADILPKARGEASAMKERAEAYKQRVETVARGEGSRFLKVLEEYQKAPEVTRQRLYLDAMEMVLSRSSKVVVDTKGGNNLMLLPLDKLISQSAGADAATGSGRDTTTEILRGLRQPGDRRSGRER